MKKYNSFAKTFLCVVMALMMVFTLCACTARQFEIQTQNPDGSPTLAGVFLEQAVNIVFRAIEAAVMIFAAWALKKFGSNKNIQSLSIATQLICDMAIQSAGELQQTVVLGLKATNGDGKLTAEQIDDLAYRLFNMTKAKLSDAVKELVIASGADLDAIITGACESLLSSWKGAFLPIQTLTDNGELNTEEPDQVLEPAATPVTF